MPATDNFAGFLPGLGAPYEKAEAVSKSDTVDLTYVTRALWVGGTGNVTVIMKDGSTVAFTAVPAGSLLHIRCSRVKDTGTSASNMVALS